MSPRNPSSARRETSVWIRRSGLGSDSQLEEHVAALVRLVNGCREKLTRLSVDDDLELCLGFGSENGQGGRVAHPQRGSALPVLLPALETLHGLQP